MLRGVQGYGEGESGRMGEAPERAVRIHRGPPEKFALLMVHLLKVAMLRQTAATCDTC